MEICIGTTQHKITPPDQICDTRTVSHKICDWKEKRDIKNSGTFSKIGSKKKAIKFRFSFD